MQKIRISRNSLSRTFYSKNVLKLIGFKNKFDRPAFCRAIVWVLTSSKTFPND